MKTKNKLSQIEQTTRRNIRNGLLSLIAPTVLLILHFVSPVIPIIILLLYVWTRFCMDINQFFKWERRREIEPRELGLWALYPLLWVMEQPGYAEWLKERDGEVTAEIYKK